MSAPIRRIAAAVFALGALARETVAHADVVHVVQAGETLASIAQRYYGNPAREATLVAANVLGAQIDASIVPGVHLVVPSVSFVRAQLGDRWDRLAERELGSTSRASHLAHVNNAIVTVAPSPGAVVRVPYLLRYVVLDETPLYEIARRFYGDRALVQFILEFNRLSSSHVQRGQTLLLPLADLELRDAETDETTRALARASTVQRALDEEIPTLVSLVAHGQYVEAVMLGARLTAASDRTVRQRIAIDRALAEAQCALGRQDLAAEALRDAVSADVSFALDPRTTSPKMLEAFDVARGLGTGRAIDPAPTTARPPDAH